MEHIKQEAYACTRCEKFRDIAAEFYNKWDFPHYVESVDGKHIRIKIPFKPGSMFYNYKQVFFHNTFSSDEWQVQVFVSRRRSLW